MTDPRAPHRIPPAPPPVRRARVLSLALTAALALAACGEEPAERPGAVAETADTAPGGTAVADAPAADTVPADTAAGTGTAPTSAADTPAGTDVWLGELVAEGDSLAVVELRNVTDRRGYDNQPAFTPDAGSVLYTAVDSTGQADTWRYDIAADQLVRVTLTSPESEYSPTPIPGSDGFSVVRVEADSTQRLWRFGPSGGDEEVLFPSVAPVGYHAWVGEERVVMFILGDPATLEVAERGSGGTREVARDVGRSIQTLPDGSGVSFVQLAPEEGVASRIMRWTPEEGVTPLVDALDGGDFHAWTPDGVLLMGSGAEIRAWSEGDATWRTVGRVPGGGTVSRLAVSPDGTRIAVVVEPPGPA